MISGYQATDYTCSQSCAINSEKTAGIVVSNLVWFGKGTMVKK